MANGTRRPGALQDFIRSKSWDEEAVRRNICRLVRRDHDDPKGIAVIDETIVRREGKSTAGVHEHYSEETGEKETCLLAIHVGYSAAGFETLLDGDLYMPQGSWVTDPADGTESWIPDVIDPRPKWRIALQLLERTVAWGVNIPWVATGREYGEIGDFRFGLKEAGLRYVVEVAPTFLGWTRCADLEDPLELSEGEKEYDKPRFGRREGPSSQISRVWEQLEADTPVTNVRDSDFGPYVWRAAEIGFFPNVSGLPSERQRLIVAKPIVGGSWRFFLSNAPTEIPLHRLVKVAFARAPLEERLESAKAKVGLADFSARQYDAITRHLSITNMSLYFLGENVNPLLDMGEEDDWAPSWTDERPATARPKSRKNKMVIVEELQETPDDILIHWEDPEVESWEAASPTLARPKIKEKKPSGPLKAVPSKDIAKARWEDWQDGKSKYVDGAAPGVEVTPDEPPLPLSTALWLWMPIHTTKQRVLLGIVGLMFVGWAFSTIYEAEVSDGIAVAEAGGEPRWKELQRMIRRGHTGREYSRSRTLFAFAPYAGTRYSRTYSNRTIVDVLLDIPENERRWEPVLRQAASKEGGLQNVAQFTLANKERETLPYLLKVLELCEKEEDCDSLLVDAVLQILSLMESDRATNAVKKMAQYGPPWIRPSALACLPDPSSPESLNIAFGALGDEDEACRGRARMMLAQAGPAAEARILEALKEGETYDEGKVIEMVLLLSDHWIDGAFYPVLSLLEHPSADVRLAAIRTLTLYKNGPPAQRYEAKLAIRRRLGDEDGWVRKQAAHSLRVVGDESDLVELVEMLMDPHSGAQRAARDTLVHLAGTDIGPSYFGWKRYLEETYGSTGRP